MEYFQKTQGLRSGPEDKEQLFDWPADLLGHLMRGRHSSRRLARLLHNLECGLVLSTDFSGKGSCEICLRMLGRAFENSGFVLPGIAVWSANDIAKHCWELLSSDKDGACHVFTGLLEQLPLGDQREIMNLRPSKDDALEVKRSAYAAQDAADKKKRDQEQEAYEKKRLTKVRRMEAFLVKNLPKVREFAQDDWVSKRDEFDFSVPFIITPAKVMSDTMVDPSNQITGCMQRWKDCYSNTDFARQSGMVHAPVMKAYGKDDADEWLRQVVSKGDLLESALPRYQKHKDSFTLYGYTDAFVNFDTELDYLGSIRFLTHGKLDVVLLPASSCAKASEKRGSKLTLVDAISFVEGISETPAQDIKVVRGTIPEMSIFYTPPGWICGYTNPEVPADASNRPPCCGVRCSILPKKSTEASEKEFVALKKLQGTDSEWLQDLISIVQAAKVQRAQAAPC